jgi:dehydrodolichyl diphosphate syntase complex subunit NUS1
MRKRVPSHLAIIFVADSYFDNETIEMSLLESVERAVGWCRVTGIEKLTVYDSQGE